MEKLLLLLLIFLTACAAQNPVSENIAVVKTSTPAQRPTETIKSNTENLKPIINFFSLANKSAKQIEQIYGKPDYIDTKYVQSENGEYRIYNKSGKRFLQVDYFDGKAVAFYLEIPDELRTQSPGDTLKICGLDLKLSEGQKEKIPFPGYQWNNSPAPFYRTRIQSYGESGIFWNCEVHIKVK